MPPAIIEQEEEEEEYYYEDEFEEAESPAGKPAAEDSSASSPNQIIDPDPPAPARLEALFEDIVSLDSSHRTETIRAPQLSAVSPVAGKAASLFHSPSQVVSKPASPTERKQKLERKTKKWTQAEREARAKVHQVRRILHSPPPALGESTILARPRIDSSSKPVLRKNPADTLGASQNRKKKNSSKAAAVRWIDPWGSQQAEQRKAAYGGKLATYQKLTACARVSEDCVSEAGSAWRTSDWDTQSSSGWSWVQTTKSWGQASDAQTEFDEFLQEDESQLHDDHFMTERIEVDAVRSSVRPMSGMPSRSRPQSSKVPERKMRPRSGMPKRPFSSTTGSRPMSGMYNREESIRSVGNHQPTDSRAVLQPCRGSGVGSTSRPMSSLGSRQRPKAQPRASSSMRCPADSTTGTSGIIGHDPVTSQEIAQEIMRVTNRHKGDGLATVADLRTYCFQKDEALVAWLTGSGRRNFMHFDQDKKGALSAVELELAVDAYHSHQQGAPVAPKASHSDLVALLSSHQQRLGLEARKEELKEKDPAGGWAAHFLKFQDVSDWPPRKGLRSLLKV